MIKYPGGQSFEKEEIKSSPKKEKKVLLSARNRGMSLENDINISNEYYIEHDIAVITKRPTPINVVKVDYSRGALITQAYFEEQSTTDYNGVFQGKYIDFEAKSTQKDTSFPLNNITKHQIKHLERVIRHGGIAFFIIEFVHLNEYYLLDAKYVIDFYNNQERKSIPYKAIKENGKLIKQGVRPRLHYLDIVKELYF